MIVITPFYKNDDYVGRIIYKDVMHLFSFNFIIWSILYAICSMAYVMQTGHSTFNFDLYF